MTRVDGSFCALSRGNRIVINAVHPRCDSWLEANSERLPSDQRVVSNLILNAAEVIAIGGVTAIGLECLKEAGITAVHMKIGDSGPGIANKHEDRILEAFFATGRMPAWDSAIGFHEKSSRDRAVPSS